MVSHLFLKTISIGSRVGMVLLIAVSVLLPHASHAQTPDPSSNSLISTLAGVSSGDTMISAACACSGVITNCTDSGSCTDKAYLGCGPVEKAGDCDASAFSDSVSWCKGSTSFLCSFNTKIYVKMQVCKSQALTPSAPYRLANVDVLCASLKEQVSDDVAKNQAEADAAERALQGVGTPIAIRKPLLNILIPDLTFSDVRSTTDDQGNIAIPWIGEYIAAVYRLAVTMASILAVILLIREGALIILSGGGEEKIAGYRNITRILVGLMLAWSSYVILFNINASLVSFRPLQIKYAQLVTVDEAAEQASDVPYKYSVGSNNVPYYAQWEGPWAKKKPGDFEWPLSGVEGKKCSTIRERGCGSTSLAMVLQFYNQNVTPLDTARWGLGCTDAWQPSLTMKNFSSQWPEMKGETIWRSSQNVLRRKIMTLLINKKPLVYNCAPCSGLNRSGEQAHVYAGHYVVLTGIATPNYSDSMEPGAVLLTVNDPGANEDRRIRTMTLADVLQNFRLAVYIDKAEDFKSINK